MLSIFFLSGKDRRFKLVLFVFRFDNDPDIRQSLYLGRNGGYLLLTQGKFIGCKSLEWFFLKEFNFHARYRFQNKLVRCEFFPVFAVMPQSTCNGIGVIMALTNLSCCCWPLPAPLPLPLLADRSPLHGLNG